LRAPSAPASGPGDSDAVPDNDTCRRLVHALDSVPDGVIVVDAAGREEFRNTAALRFRDARHAEALAEHAVAQLVERARQGEVAERELPLFGPPREVLVLRALPLGDDGDALGAVALIHDVTDARRVESVRRDFVANVSHELKTPIGALGLLAETIASADDVEVVRRLAEQLVRESDRLGRIVDDLLDLSLIEAQAAPTREPTPVHVLVEEAVERLGALALARGIPLRTEPADEDLMVRCDPTQLVSAITNLLDNAVKYSDDDSVVEVRVRSIADAPETTWAEVSVEDHGIGIPTRDLERIFERFYRVDRARARDTGGTGLGLAIVRHVATNHRGEVSVVSHEGQGSVFTLRLPAGPGPVILTAPEQEAG
jgi:two-component system, OmpR family, sensor histidine kinase SenX3